MLGNKLYIVENITG